MSHLPRLLCIFLKLSALNTKELKIEIIFERNFVWEIKKITRRKRNSSGNKQEQQPSRLPMRIMLIQKPIREQNGITGWIVELDNVVFATPNVPTVVTPEFTEFAIKVIVVAKDELEVVAVFKMLNFHWVESFIGSDNGIQ